MTGTNEKEISNITNAALEVAKNYPCFPTDDKSFEFDEGKCNKNVKPYVTQALGALRKLEKSLGLRQN